LHPGGDAVLLPYLGKDITQSFTDPDVHRHSMAAYNLMKKFKIGYVIGEIAESEIQKALNETKIPEDYGVDLKKGLVWQSAKLGSNYIEFVEKTFLAPENGTLRYFDSNLLETFSKSPWYTVPLLWIPILIFMITVAINNDIKFSLFPLMVFGFLSWCLVEYLLHRFLFHMKTSSIGMNAFHFMLHGYHHVAPMDPFRLTFPPIPALLVGAILYTVVSAFFGIGSTFGILSGLTVGYILYDLEHYALHHSSFLNSISYYKKMKRHHLYHHYKNDSANFGISTMIFDTVFNSFDPVYMENKKKSM